MKDFPLLENPQGTKLIHNWEETIIKPLKIAVNYLINYSKYINPCYKEIEFPYQATEDSDEEITYPYSTIAQLPYKKYWVLKENIKLEIQGQLKYLQSGTIVLNKANKINAASFFPNYDYVAYSWDDFLIQKQGFAGYFLTIRNGNNLTFTYDNKAEEIEGLIYPADFISNRAYHLRTPIPGSETSTPIDIINDDIIHTGTYNNDPLTLKWININVPPMLFYTRSRVLGESGHTITYYDEIITDYKWSIGTTSEIINYDKDNHLHLIIKDSEEIRDTTFEVR